MFEVPQGSLAEPAIDYEVLENESRTGYLRNKILSVITTGILIAGGVTTIEALGEGEAHAATTAYSDLGYPDAKMPCEHAPYNTTGKCANYDWGPTHTEKYDDASEYSSRGYTYRNCTDYVAWKMGTLGVTIPHGLGGGGHWYDNSPSSQRSSTPKAGEAAVKSWTSTDPYGHVAYVESVNSDGTITVSEYNHNQQGDGDKRTGTAASMGFTEFVDFGVNVSNSGGSSEDTSLADGKFVKVNESNAIYRMVGGAPIRIYNQGALPDFNGTVTNISNDQLGRLPRYPNNENDIINVVEAGNAKYRMVGGAPVRIFNCDPVPDHCAGAINVNFQSLAELDHMNARPADGAVMSISEAGGAGIYRFVGGAPVRLYNWGAISDMPNAAWVNEQSLASLDHMNARPSDGVAISIAEAGGAGIYRFVGGAPIRLYNQGAIPDMPNVVIVNAQSVGDLDHMNAVPTNGEFVASAETGTVYRVAGGAALKLYNQGSIPGYNGAVFVNQQTLDTHDHLLTAPANGTVLKGVSSGALWKITDGKRSQVSTGEAPVTVDEQTIADIPQS